MKFGIAEYGVNVWEGGCFDIEQRLKDYKKIGYEGTERLPAIDAADAVKNAGLCRRLGMTRAISPRWADPPAAPRRRIGTWPGRSRASRAPTRR